jgi:hypothetical protein
MKVTVARRPGIAIAAQPQHDVAIKVSSAPRAALPRWLREGTTPRLLCALQRVVCVAKDILSLRHFYCREHAILTLLTGEHASRGVRLSGAQCHANAAVHVSTAVLVCVRWGAAANVQGSVKLLDAFLTAAPEKAGGNDAVSVEWVDPASLYSPPSLGDQETDADSSGGSCLALWPCPPRPALTPHSL